MMMASSVILYSIAHASPTVHSHDYLLDETSRNQRTNAFSRDSTM